MSRPHARQLIAIALLVSWPLTAQAVEVIHYDEYSSQFNEAAGQIQGATIAVQPGYAEGEAYGVVFRLGDEGHPSGMLDASDFPLRIVGVDAFFGGPPETTQPQGAHVDIELWWGLSDDAGPPGGAGSWTINTSDFSDFSSAGSVILGATFAQFDFNEDDPDGAPPLITAPADIWLMFKFTTPAQDMMDYWGTAQCMALPQFGACGCQPIASGHDSITTPNVNVMRTKGLGICNGESKNWNYAEDFGVNGDVIARLRVEAADGQIGGDTCMPSCADKDCGDDGCGGLCGSCLDDEVCVAGSCEATGGGCTPSCEGKTCGDDGCGGVCGLCAGNELCVQGNCQCAPSCDGKTCGDDGCGGVCGTCTDLEACVQGNCQCVPNCSSKDCGDDGCGGQCGTCDDGQTCDAGVCQCVPDCTDKDCGDDGCGSPCGACDDGQTCDAGACQCVPDCTDKDCGDDGCGGQCGACDDGQTCDAGACQCVPNCSSKACGDDGCGNPCGLCEGGMSCNEGVCVMSTDGLSITSISPAFGTVGEQTDVSITGTDFMVGLTVRVGATTIGVREVTGTQLITAIIPGDLNIGVYDVVVVNPDDAVATLPGAFEVRASGALSATTCGDGACESGEDCEACPIDCGPCEAVVPARSSGCSSGNGASIIWPLLVIIGWMTNRRRLPGVAQC